MVVAAASLLAGLFLAEGLLAWLGSPAELLETIANPPGYRLDVDYEEFSYRWETNDQGLRYATIPLHKPAGTRRVFIVGDSFVDGEGVAIEARFTSRLEDRFGGAARDNTRASSVGSARATSQTGC